MTPLVEKIERLKLRDRATENEIKDRMKNQMKDEEKAGLADFVIVNNELKETEKEVFRVYQKLVSTQ
jgi:dephospho-CoA kinase